MTDKQIIIDGKTIGCPCYINRPLHRYDKACLVQSQVFTEQQTEEKPILRCDEIKNCPIKEIYKQFKRKEEELQAQRNFTTQEQRKIYCVAYDKTCENGNECKQKKCMFKDRLKYKQALDEIEKLIPKFDTSDGCSYSDYDCENCSDLDEDVVCTYKLKKTIKNIINKTKE